MGIGPLLVQHVLYSLAGVLIAALIGVPAAGGWGTPARANLGATAQRHGPLPAHPWPHRRCSASFSGSA